MSSLPLLWMGLTCSCSPLQENLEVSTPDTQALQCHLFLRKRHDILSILFTDQTRNVTEFPQGKITSDPHQDPLPISVEDKQVLILFSFLP